MAERGVNDRASDLSTSHIRTNASGYKTGDIVAGRYRIERLVGEGGMGQVLAATHIGLGQEVAIKIMLAEKAKDSDSVERFLREARAAVMLKSSHVARVHDVGTTEIGLPYIVMELLEGKDLFTLMMENGALPYKEAVEALLHACDAVAEAHEHGIIHRDLKPENLFLTQRRDGTAIVKVLDFGISKLGIDPAAVRKGRRMVTQENTVLGSPSYMSPEQVRNSKRVDERSDIYSLGVTLFELLTAAEPFGGESTPEIFVNVLTTVPTAPHLVVPSIPPDLSAVVMRCIEKEPAARFQTVKELANALLPFTSGKPTSIAPSWGNVEAPPDSSSLVKRLSVPNPPPASHRTLQMSTPQAFPVRPYNYTPEGSPASSPGMPVSATIAEMRAASGRSSGGGVIAVAAIVGVLAIVIGVVVWRSSHATAPSAAASTDVPPPPVSGEAQSTPDDPSSLGGLAATKDLGDLGPVGAPASSTSATSGAKPGRPGGPPRPVAAPRPAGAPKPSALPRERTSW